jgi:hypothetical protein
MGWQAPEDVVRDHLESGERLLWSGQPAQGIRLRGHDVFLIPLSLLWGGFALFWEIMALGAFISVAGEADGPPSIVAIIFPLFGLPFVLVGLYLIAGRFFVDARQRARTFYGVTDTRIIIVSGPWARRVKSLNLRTLSDLSMSQKADGTGTVTFGPAHPYAAFFGGASWPGWGWHSAPSFDLVPHVAEVYNAIRDAQKAAWESPSSGRQGTQEDRLR